MYYVVLLIRKSEGFSGTTLNSYVSIISREDIKNNSLIGNE